MNETCPKCGAKERTDARVGNLRRYECGTLTEAGDVCAQGNDCIRSQKTRLESQLAAETERADAAERDFDKVLSSDKINRCVTGFDELGKGLRDKCNDVDCAECWREAIRNAATREAKEDES